MEEKNLIDLSNELDIKYGDLDNYPKAELKKLREKEEEILKLSGFNQNELHFLLLIKKHNIFSIMNDYAWWGVLMRDKEVLNG